MPTAALRRESGLGADGLLRVGGSSRQAGQGHGAEIVHIIAHEGDPPRGPSPCRAAKARRAAALSLPPLVMSVSAELGGKAVDQRAVLAGDQRDQEPGLAGERHRHDVGEAETFPFRPVRTPPTPPSVSTPSNQRDRRISAGTT